MTPNIDTKTDNKKDNLRIDVRLSLAKIDTAIKTFDLLGHKYKLADISKVTGLSVRTVSKYYKMMQQEKNG